METHIEDFIPRAYQVELYEIACKENIIVYLPTGSGKTYIAVMLIKKLSADIQKSYDEGRKHTVFIVNTLPLVIQQRDYIRRLTGFSCGAFSSEEGVDFWHTKDWNAQLKQHNVLVMTSQILVNALCHGYMSLNRINLIIFDECHRAVNDHPMRQIMQFFQNCSKREQPKVLGLSATLLNANVKMEKIKSVVQSLEVTFNAKITTAIITHKEYYTSPNEEIVIFNRYIVDNVGKSINNIIQDVKNILNYVILKDVWKYYESSKEFRPKTISQKLQNVLMDIQYQLSSTGIYGASKCILLYLIQLECLKKATDDAEAIYILEYIISKISTCRKLLEDEMKEKEEKERIYKYSSDQVRQLFKILKDFYKNKTDDQIFFCIIFVKRRFTAKILYQILKNISMHDEEYKFLHPDFLMGVSVNPYKNSKELLCISKRNKEVLLRFRNGLLNCLVATDIIDEGIDVPKCSLVVRYDFPLDVRTYIQSKGRARHVCSHYKILVQKDESQYLQRYNEFQMTEKYLKKYLEEKSYERRNLPTEDEIKNELYQYTIEPYIITGNDGQMCCITEQMAINVINEYCTSLMKSKFTCLSPTWILHRISENSNNTKVNKYQVSLKLPLPSPLRTVIFSDSMPSVSGAKRSAAMKMCKELHKIGELTDKLQPVTAESLQKDLSYLFPNWNDENESEKDLIGTYKRKRHYQLQFPSALYGVFPRPQKQVYLHILHATPKFSAPHHDNRHLIFYNLLHNNAGFGILSTKQILEIPSFPIFMNLGELNIDVKVNHTTMFLSGNEISLLKSFHTLIFDEIVQVIKLFMVFDNYNLDNCFLIVPVDENWDINWKVINGHKSIEHISPPVPFHFKTTDYELALIKPNYRAAETYIVTQVCHDITPNSCFPTDNFSSYAHYYKEKHGLVISDLRQPMLEVKSISRTIDYIIPRHMHSESKNRRYVDSPKNLKEHLVPELCTKINFPALYWLKATTLPSILHRISQLLIAEDLRCLIVKETSLGLLSNNKWPPLEITEEEGEDSFEPLLETSTMEKDNFQSEPVLNGPEIDVLNTESYHYPWSRYQEPPDLDRNIEEIQLIQIEHYCQLMNEKQDKNNMIIANENINFLIKPSVSVPPLQILLLKNSRGPDPVQIMYALTTKLGHDAFNLERLETLGDSYLKFIISLFLYNNFPKYTEGHLTALKGKIIGNRNLYYCGVKKHIPGRMKVDGFVVSSNFIAPAYTVHRQIQNVLIDAEVSPNVLYEIQIPKDEQFSGQISETTMNVMQTKILNWETAESQTGMEHYLGLQTVSDKAIADCVEALIGVYLRSMGIKDTLTLLQWFQILPSEIDVDALLFGTPQNPIICEGNINSFMPWASKIESQLGYKFNNKGYLLQAFTHPSYTPNNMTECYQRLEFLGDAILDFLITNYIYENCGNLNPGALTDLRSALVNNIIFACLTVRHGLHVALLSYTPELNNTIERFVKFQEDRNFAVNDELLWILLEEDECNMAEHVEVPKVLGDIFESTIGAIYLDSNKDLTTVWNIIYSIMHKEIDEFSKNIPKQPIRVLYETQGANPLFLKSSVVDNTNIIMVPLKVTIAGKVKHFHGFGANKKQAKCAAAKQALKNLLCKK
ncbi:endoribonuclease Dicer [Frieseomelitta varia]|uniref:endoribonuclease Dicer n=1 Tax=Frieseomelitta varia TaxID=561572 RepID=UPI001CB68958|nr:endoribonuclease Dicer [Frieseomelitta varia]